ncbi:MAG: hypothetical protein ACYSWX_04110 [Planctomycetota bacterium]
MHSRALLSTALAITFAVGLGPSAEARPQAAEQSTEASTLAPALPVLPAEPVQQLRLRDGRILWGWIEEHSPEDLIVFRLDTGGRVRLPWVLLDPEQEQEFKQLFGYSALTDQELSILATRLRTVSGDEFVGIVMSETNDTIELKTVNGFLRVPRVQLAGPLLEELVPAREVYTRDELYERELDTFKEALVSELTPPAEKAEMHWEMARFCEQIFDYRRADFHYRAIGEVDPTFDHPDLAGAMLRAASLSVAQEQADELELIDRLRLKDDFPECLVRLDRFGQLYPDSPLTEDVARLRAAVLRDRERQMLREVELRWHHWVGRLARERARSDDYESTLVWIQELMSDEVAALVTADMREYQSDADETRIRELWSQRDKRRSRRASYGVGTWILGRDNAVAEVLAPDEEPDRDELTDARSAERKELEDRIQRYLKSQQLAASGRSNTQQAEDPSQFWSTWTGLSRTQWVIAYYAENMGDMQLTRATTRPCRECQGQGALEFSTASDGGGTRLLQCHMCHGVPVIRRVSYR